MAIGLGHKCFHFYNKILVILYIIFGITFFCIEEWLFEEIYDSQLYAHATEAAFISLFLLDIVVHSVTFGSLFACDVYSILDTVVILLNLTFVILHIALTPAEEEKVLHPLAKVYGVFRILHACLVFKKMDEVIKNKSPFHRIKRKIEGTGKEQAEALVKDLIKTENISWKLENLNFVLNELQTNRL